MDFINKNITKIEKGVQRNRINTLIGVFIAGLIFILGACGSPGTNTVVKATWIEPELVGDTIAIPVSEINNNQIIHFNLVSSPDKQMAFMVYDLSGEIYARANVCPPCRSVGFSLSGDTLICDTCKTTFDAETGEGIKGGCVGYPKKDVFYKINNGNAMMAIADLEIAYLETLLPTLPR